MGALMRLLGLVLMLALVYWAVTGVLLEVRYRRRSSAIRDTSDARGRPMRAPHQRVTDEALEARAQELRRALQQGLVSMDEAVGSLVRFGGAAISVERAQRLLE